MRHRTFRIRRAALTLMLGASAAGGAIASGVVAGTAQAATTGSISASTTPAINTTGTNQAAGNLTVTLPTTAIAATEYVDVLVTANATGPVGSNTICYYNTPTISSNGVLVSATGMLTQTGTTCPASGAGNILQLTIPAQTPTSPATISISGVSYNTALATGTLQVYGWTDSATGDIANPPGTQTGTLAPYPTSNGTLPAAPPGTPNTLTVAAATSPTIGVGLANQPGGNLAVTLGASATTQGWQQGYLVAVNVADNAGGNCSGNDFVGFAAVGTVTVTTSNWGTAAAPTVTPTRAYYSPCGSSVANDLLLTFGNTGTFPASNASFTITVSGIQYTTGTSTPVGALQVKADYESTLGTSLKSFPASAATAPTGPSDAIVSTTVVTANSPAVNVPGGSLNSPISPITLTEATPGAVTPGWVCITLSNTGATSFTPSSGSVGTNAFDPASTPKVTVTSGPGTVNSTASFETVNSGTTDNTVAFDITTVPPQTTASTYQISGLGVDSTTGTGFTPGPVLALVTYGVTSATACPTASQPTSSTLPAYAVANTGNRTYGANADATAAAEMYAAFNYQNANGKSNCPGTGGSTLTGTFVASRPVVLATDTNYPDALDGGYLASDLQTGELLTPINSLSAPTLQALRLEGISQVYIVGGPYVVSNAVVTQLQNTPVYTCGGQTPVTTLLGTAQNITVTRIYGQTEYDTAAQIAEFPGGGYVGKKSFVGAYAGTNSSKGMGAYNDTAGQASATALNSQQLPTAIVATGQGFQDAEAAGVLSYANNFPILLTTPSALSTQTQSALQALGIQQVIVMGGPLAVSDAVVTSIQNLGISVLRIAGTDFTDTATQLANFEMNTVTGGLGLGWTPHGDLFVARGDFYSDGLAGALDAATNSAGGNTSCVGGANANSPSPSTCTMTPVPLLLTTNPNTVGTALTSFLNQAGSPAGIDKLNTATVSSLNVLGGPLAVTPATVSAMNAALAAG